MEYADFLNILGILIGLVNYNANLTQNDKQDIMKSFQQQATIVLNEIHAHLEKQDELLEELLNGKNVQSN